MSRSDLSRRSLLLSGGALALSAGLLTQAAPALASTPDAPAPDFPSAPDVPAAPGLPSAPEVPPAPGAPPAPGVPGMGGSAPVNYSPYGALAELVAGNARFLAGQSQHPHQGLDDLHALAAGQHPFAITLGCADSRVSPEVLFDQGLGDIFDNRVAGNIVDDLLLGSIEFAVEEFETPLIVVLGHERCGAINATIGAIETGAPAPGHIGTIVKALRPIVQPVLHHPGDKVENAVRANIRAQKAQLLRRSSLLAARVRADSLHIVGARYDLDTGAVTIYP